MSTVHDTTTLKHYKVGGFPSLEEGLPLYLTRELQTISATLNQLVVAMKAIEERIVAGGL